MGDESDNGDVIMRKVDEEKGEGQSYNVSEAALNADSGNQSDKENQESITENDSSSVPSQQPPLQQQPSHYDQKPPLPGKKRLKEWLEKHASNTNDLSGPLDESEDAVASREMSKELSPQGTASSEHLVFVKSHNQSRSNTDLFFGKTGISGN